jgi:hypothetical protein
VTRAGVFIGVDQTGQLQRLQDAAAGAARMHAWALSQGMADRTHAKLITDANGQKVTPDMILDAIQEIIDGPGVDQLIVYFAGHGINRNRSEHWLLSDAPGRAHAAVNMAGSVDQARYSGIPYVVFISDACRVAPEGIQAQRVDGVEIFPNDTVSERAKPVDQFFACLLGRTAAEIKDPQEAAAGFSALYTAALLDGLSGKLPAVLQPADGAGDNARYVRPARLRDELELELPRRLLAGGLATRVNQSPDAIVTAHDYWLARIDVPAVRTTRGGHPTPAPPAGPPGASAVVRNLVRLATAEPASLPLAIERAQAAAVPGVDDLVATAARVAEPFGPDHHETECGVKVQGARIAEFLIVEGRAEHAAEGTDLRVYPPPMPVSMVLQFDSGMGTVVPCIPGFMTALTFDEGELVDVALEPATTHDRWNEYQHHAHEIRTLRGVVAAASRQGRFRLDGPEALTLAQRMQYAKSIDPALALYAAYAYHDLQELGRLRQMSGYLRNDLSAGMFDVAMLARELVDVRVDRGAGVVPFVPLLSQGWALLRAHRVRLHHALDDVQEHVRDSLWSLYDAQGVDMLRHALTTREVW